MLPSKFSYLKEERKRLTQSIVKDKNMLSKGIEIRLVAEITGLPIDKVEEIRKQ